VKRALAPASLDTPRMTGEPIGPEHEAAIAGLMLDPRVYRSRPWASAPTLADVRASLADKRDHWERHGFGLWLLRDRHTGLVVGRGGLQYTDAIGGFAVEAAWTIAPERWGEGLPPSSPWRRSPWPSTCSTSTSSSRSRCPTTSPLGA
jgi:RimJ/RimL family protein N-acetyltransferase